LHQVNGPENKSRRLKMSFKKHDDRNYDLSKSVYKSGGIIVLGEALIDVFPQRRVVGGAPFNVACSVAALGVNVCLVTRLGDDENGQLVRAEAARFGVGLAGLQSDPIRPTGTVQVEVTADENYYTIADDQAWDHLQQEPALEACAGIAADYLYFGTLAQRSIESRETIRRLVKEFTGIVYLDLNLRDMPDIRAICEDSLALADIVKVNEEELRKLFQWLGHREAEVAVWQTQIFMSAVLALVKKFALTGLLVTRGTKGYAYFDKNGNISVEGAAVAGVVVADTVGAGDSFSAMFLASQVQGMTIELSLKRASELAAAICGVHGAVPTSREFYSRWCAPHISGDAKHKEAHIHG
jgi:fructokinase